MSIDYDSDLAFGFFFVPEDLSAAFGRDFPKEVRLEPRWDPHTGEKLEDVEVVVREAGRYLVLGDQAYDDSGSGLWEFITALAEFVEADASFDGDWMSGHINFVVIGPNVDDLSKLAELDPHAVVQARQELYLLETRLKDAGIEVEAPGSFHAVGSIS